MIKIGREPGDFKNIISKKSFWKLADWELADTEKQVFAFSVSAFNYGRRTDVSRSSRP